MPSVVDSSARAVSNSPCPVRSRAVMSCVKNEAGEPIDSDLRELQFKKNQYGPLAARVVVRYRDGLFLPVPGMSSLNRVALEQKAEDVFLDMLRRFARESPRVVPPNLSAVARSLYGAPPRCCGLCFQLASPPRLPPPLLSRLPPPRAG